MIHDTTEPEWASLETAPWEAPEEHFKPQELGTLKEAQKWNSIAFIILIGLQKIIHFFSEAGTASICVSPGKLYRQKKGWAPSVTANCSFGRSAVNMLVMAHGSRSASYLHSQGKIDITENSYSRTRQVEIGELIWEPVSVYSYIISDLSERLEELLRPHDTHRVHVMDIISLGLPQDSSY